MLSSVIFSSSRLYAAGAAGAVVIPLAALFALGVMSDRDWARIALLRMLVRIKKLIERGELL